MKVSPGDCLSNNSPLFNVNVEYLHKKLTFVAKCACALYTQKLVESLQVLFFFLSRVGLNKTLMFPLSLICARVVTTIT